MTKSAPKLVCGLRINPESLSASITINRPMVTHQKIDPVMEIFVSIRKKYDEKIHIVIYSTGNNAAGKQYSFIPGNIEDNEEGVPVKFEEYLRWFILPEFEERLELFFKDKEDGYEKYRQLLEANRIEEAEKAIRSFIYKVADADEKKHMDKKIKKEAKKAEEAKEAAEKNKRFLTSLGLPAQMLSLFL